MTATAGAGDCGDPTVIMNRDDHPFIVNATCHGQPVCTASYELPACDTPRTYTIDVIGQCGIRAPNQSGDIICTAHETTTTVSVTLDPVAPTVDVTYLAAGNGAGTLAVDYVFHEPPAGDINLYRGESTTPFVSATSSQLGQSGIWEVPLDTACWPTGTHTIRAEAATCGRFGDERYMGVGGTSITIDNKPDVSLSAAPGSNEEVSFTTTYQFRNTTSGRLDLFVDETLIDTKTGLSGEGSWVTAASLGGCWRTARVVASACDEAAEDEIQNEEQRPSVSVTLRKAVDPANGRFEALVTYDLREPIPNRYVRVERLSWTDADGTEHPDGQQLGFRDASDPLSDSEWVIPFDPPSGARHVNVRVTAQSCGRDSRNAGIACDCDSTQAPVYFADGNMRLTDVDPLPPVAGHALTRTYDSDEQIVGLFGRGFTTLFEQRLMRHTVDGGEVVSIVSAANDIVLFDRVGSVFRQTWPAWQAALGTLSLDTAAQTYTLRNANATEVALFRASDGKLAALRDLATGREARITYGSNGLPQTLSDSWTGVTWTLTIEARRVRSIAIAGRPDLTWQYQYDPQGNLVSVLAPGGAVWRTYEYSGNRMTASYDALGNLIESHHFDAHGYATDSTGLGDEIQNIAYNLAGSTPSERVTRVTMKTGALTEYVLRPAGGGYRIVQVKGSCASCGGGTGDRTYARDERGRIVREQHPDGFITVTTYRDDVRVAEQRYVKPADCNPHTATDRCRLTTGGLASAVLEPTTATIETHYSYADVNWPNARR